MSDTTPAPDDHDAAPSDGDFGRAAAEKAEAADRIEAHGDDPAAHEPEGGESGPPAASKASEGTPPAG